MEYDYRYTDYISISIIEEDGDTIVDVAIKEWMPRFWSFTMTKLPIK